MTEEERLKQNKKELIRIVKQFLKDKKADPGRYPIPEEKLPFVDAQSPSCDVFSKN